jgi:hypothetical protein
MRWIILLLIATTCAVTDATPAAAQLTGMYRLTRVQEQALPAMSPDEDNVILMDAFLVLREDGRYAFGILANHWMDNRIENRQAAGSYLVEGDTLILQPDSVADVVRWTFLREAETLTVTDEHEHSFVFTRQPGGPAPPRASEGPRRGMGATAGRAEKPE